MNKPPVAIIMLNYNSNNFIDYVKKAISSALTQKYDNIHFYFVDNSSSDGSYEQIKDFIGKERSVSLIKFRQNYGFNDAINIVWRKMIRAKYKYLLIQNNDAYLLEDFIEELVKIMESKPDIGIIQPLVLKWGNNDIDTSGYFIDENLNFYPTHKTIDLTYGRILYISHAETTVPLIRNKAIIESVSTEYIFAPGSFCYWFDGVYLGRKLWKTNYKAALYSVPLAYHRRSETVKRYIHSLKLNYYFLRNKLAFIKLITDMSLFKKKLLIMRLIYREFVHNKSLQPFKIFIDSKLYANYLKRNYDEEIYLYSGPIIVDKKIKYF